MANNISDHQIDKAIQQAVQFTEISGQLKRIEDGIADLKSKNTEMANDITKIKDAIYGPDDGIYARLKSLESWKSTTTKVMWLLFTTFTTGTVAAIFSIFKKQ